MDEKRTDQNKTNLPVQQQAAALPAAVPTEALLEQVRAIQSVMHQVMRDGEHYGTIPGCGTKPTLFKSGAEKLSFTFHLRPIIDPAKDIQTTDLGNFHREYRVICHVLNQAGDELATGIGSCSTMERKYRYRSDDTGRPVPKAYWDSHDPALLGGRGFKPRKIDGEWRIVGQVEHGNPADYYNTCLKMAKKRATVDGIISATAASDMFTQDAEDLPTGIASEADVKTAAPAAPPKASHTERGNGHHSDYLAYRDDERIKTLIGEIGFDPFVAEHRMIKKYRGLPYIEVPMRALQWAIDHCDSGQTQDECRATLKVMARIEELAQNDQGSAAEDPAEADLPF